MKKYEESNRNGGVMKLPEHYEKWLRGVLSELDRCSLYRAGYIDGAHEIFCQLMADLAPAIEALTDCPCTVQERLSGHRSECLSGPALENLKENGLVEWITKAGGER
jgi:hypothetical protein